MNQIRLIEKKRYIFLYVEGRYSKEQIAAKGKEARLLGMQKDKPVVIDFRRAILAFNHSDVKKYFNQYYSENENLLKFVYVAQWFLPDSPYLKEIDQEWLDKGISTCPFSKARDIIHWIDEIENFKAR